MEHAAATGADDSPTPGTSSRIVRSVQALDRLTPTTIAAVRRIAGDARRVGSFDWAAKVTENPPHAASVVVAEGEIVTYAEARLVDRTWVVDGPVGRRDAVALPQLVARLAVVDNVTTTWWVETADAATDDAARILGLEPARELLQLRCPLPREPRSLPSVRPFRVGEDEDRWLEVNRRAFAGHPDQADWDRPRLAARMAESWFDANGFLLLEEKGELVGFCWTKEHRDVKPTMGEIHVIGVDPDHHGRGLGRGLTEAGLAHLATRGLEVGMLYVESDNVAARALYEKAGFTTHHVDRCYTSGPPDV